LVRRKASSCASTERGRNTSGKPRYARPARPRKNGSEQGSERDAKATEAPALTAANVGAVGSSWSVVLLESHDGVGIGFDAAAAGFCLSPPAARDCCSPRCAWAVGCRQAGMAAACAFGSSTASSAFSAPGSLPYSRSHQNRASALWREQSTDLSSLLEDALGSTLACQCAGSVVRAAAGWAGLHVVPWAVLGRRRAVCGARRDQTRCATC
jgi:hypothetical protein